ncbi:hypothetical protein [Bordetella bronchialis]|uniref:Uncharacterized protein n=1 Tax=Bordetella bronchialis TaxID=463025 RepID=A0ABN4QZF7_9BORD|nr:hypothetical protein [Bordetella bronchialis]ANN66458.1 hypothetical protein BAU06_09270 [Bordetella bronchialis]
MNFTLTGYLDVEYLAPKLDEDGNQVLDSKGKPILEPVEYTFDASDFTEEDGEGIGKNDEGDYYFSGHFHAAHREGFEVRLYIFVYRNQDPQQYNLELIGCRKLNDQLDWDF